MFGLPKTPVEKKLANIDANQLNTSQQGPPVPYLAGIQRMSVQWVMAPVYNLKGIKQGSDSGKGASSSSGTKWYADLMGLLCHGGVRPVDVIYTIIIDSQEAWKSETGLWRAEGEDYAQITIPKYGTIRFYWGTETQPVDTFIPTKIPWVPKGQPALPAQVHPAYHGICYFTARQFYFGSVGSTNVPNIEFIIGRGCQMFDGEVVIADGQGVNIYGPMFEALTNARYGVGFPVERLPDAAWGAAVAGAQEAGQFISPYVTQQRDFRTFIASLLPYNDGWIRRANGHDLEVGFFKHGDTDVSSLPHLTEDDLNGRPKITPGGYEDVITQTTVIHRDRAQYFHDGSQIYTDPAARQVVGSDVPDYPQMPWIIDPDQAKRWATEKGKIEAQPKDTGTLPAKREWVELHEVSAGSVVVFDGATQGSSIVFRVTATDEPEDRSGTVMLTVESERGLWPSLYIAPATPAAPGFRVQPVGLDHARVVELPSGLKTDAPVQIAVLAERPDPLMTGFRVYLSPDGVAAYDQVSPENYWAVRARLAVAYASTTGPLDTTTGLVLDLYRPDIDDLAVSQSDAQRDDNTLLLWLGSEIFSLGEITALGSDRFRCYGRRALYGTTVADHFVGAEGWIIPRVLLRPIQHAALVPGTSVHLKLPVHTDRGDEPLEEAFALTYALGTDPALGNNFGLTLTTYANPDAQGNVQSHLHAEWGFRTDADIFLFEIQWKEASADDTNWHTETAYPSSPVLDWIVPANTYIKVRIRARTRAGEPSNWSATQTIKSATTAPFTVSKLEIVGANGLGKGNDWTFDTPDVHVQCQVTSVRYEALGQETSGAQGALEDPRFGGLVWRIRDSITGAVVWGGPDGSQVTKVGDWKFRKSENVLAFGGSGKPQFFLAVAARDTEGNLGEWLEIEPYNEPPPAPGALSVIAAFQGFQASWKNPIGVPDLAGDELLYGTTSNIGSATVVDVGLTEVKTINPGAATGATLFAWARSYDTFGSRSAVTGPVQFTLGTVPAGSLSDLSQRLSAQFTNTAQLEYWEWTNHAPTSGAIQWTAPAGTVPNVWWKNVGYHVANGSTALLWVWWKGGESVFRTTDADPFLDPDWDSSDSFVIARNGEHSGVVDLVWQRFANISAEAAFIIRMAVKLGVFGQVIADEVNVIGTLQLQGQAVVLSSRAYGGESVLIGPSAAHSSDDSFFTALRLVVVSASGAKATLTASWAHADDDSFDSTDVDFRMLRNGEVFYGSGFTVRTGNTELQTFPAPDDSGLNVGTVLYEFQLRSRKVSAGPTTVYNRCHARWLVLEYSEQKKSGEEPFTVFDGTTGDVIRSGAGPAGSAAAQITTAEASAGLAVQRTRALPTRQIVDITATPDPVTGNRPVIANPFWNEP